MFSQIELKTRQIIAKRNSPTRIGIGIMVIRSGNHWTAFVGNRILEARNAMELVRKASQ